jgi:NADPH-dependent 7-cyano-7-deazaguanine reductase QueF-like protein
MGRSLYLFLYNTDKTSIPCHWSLLMKVASRSLRRESIGCALGVLVYLGYAIWTTGSIYDLSLQFDDPKGERSRTESVTYLRKV